MTARRPTGSTSHATRTPCEIQITPFEPTVLVGFATSLVATGIYSDFTTVDLTPPAVIDLSPGVDANGIALGSVVRVKYSEPIDPATLDFIDRTFAFSDRSPAVLLGDLNLLLTTPRLFDLLGMLIWGNIVLGILNVGFCDRDQSYWRRASDGFMPCVSRLEAQIGERAGHPR